MMPKGFKPDPKLDLVLERYIDVPKDLVWSIWTNPEHMKKWFTPAPWKTSNVIMDQRPGGEMTVEMESPEGEKFSYPGCYLEIVAGERITYTSALMPGFRPMPVRENVPDFTAMILMESQGSGTKYTAIAMHRDPEGKQVHEQMGFHEGWGAALDQLVATAKKMM